MFSDVDIVTVPARPVVSLRRRRWPASAPPCGACRTAGGGRPSRIQAVDGAVYADTAPGRDADYDVAIAILPGADGSVPDAVGEARGKWLPPHHVLEAVHHGPHDQMDDLGGRARGWRARRSATRPSGPITEVYEVTRADGVPPERYVHPGAGASVSGPAGRPGRGPASLRRAPAAALRCGTSWPKSGSPRATTACLGSASMSE